MVRFDLKFAIIKTGKTQRRIALDAGLPECRLSAAPAVPRHDTTKLALRFSDAPELLKFVEAMYWQVTPMYERLRRAS